MPQTSIIYYTAINKKVPFADFLDTLQKPQQTKLLRIIAHLENYGLTAIIPHTRKLTGTPLWEIRVLGKDNLRAIYAVPYDKAILILHGFAKKSPKTPHKEIQIAINRYEDWKSRH